MAVAGSIAEFAKGVLPYTWEALLTDDAFGEALLQRNVDLVKENVFGTIISTAAEEGFPLRVLKWCGKKVAIELIPSGIDLWMNQVQQESASGTQETHMWVDRAQRLESLRDKLLAEIAAEANQIAADLGRPVVTAKPLMGISTPADDLLLTPNPREFPLPYRQTRG